MILIDGSPGIGIPVIAAVGGDSAVLIMTDPTVSGKHDIKRIAKLAAHLTIDVLMPRPKI